MIMNDKHFDPPLTGGTVLTRAQIRELPLLDNPVALRIKFVKLGSLQYISHLDLQRTIGRVIARSGLPVWYTKGFNPHLKLVFATPLAVGVQSLCEHLDVRLERDVSPADFGAALNAHLTDELRAIECYYPVGDFADIASADYVFEIKTDGGSAVLARSIAEILSTSPLSVVKKNKSGDREVDIVPLISRLELSYSEASGTLRMTARLPAGSSGGLNPEFLITALREKGIILSGDPAGEWHTVIKTRLNTADGGEFR